LLGTIVHDLRNPLNVIQLSARMIEQTRHAVGADLHEDLAILRQNTQQLELMLQQLGDYCRQYETSNLSAAMRFGTKHFVSEVVELQRESAPPSAVDRPIDTEFRPAAPEDLELDLSRARLALGLALRNALIASPRGTVRIIVDGEDDRVVIRVVTDGPLKGPTIPAVSLRGDSFERLLPVAAERRALDLAIVGRITELFGGTAEFEVDTGTSSTILLRWPVRLGA
jgi:signal transduction histidine kinase